MSPSFDGSWSGAFVASVPSDDSAPTLRCRLSLRLEALERGPGFDQRAIDGEVLCAHQVRVTRLVHNAVKEHLRHLVGHQPLAVLRERARIEAVLEHAHAEEPAE